MTGVGGPLLMLEKPLIAAVQGYVLGGGFEMTMCADIVVAADTAKFGMPETKAGIMGESGIMHRSIRQLPVPDRPGHDPDGRPAVGGKRLHATVWSTRSSPPAICSTLRTGGRKSSLPCRRWPPKPLSMQCSRGRGPARRRAVYQVRADRSVRHHRGRARGTPRVQREAPPDLDRPVVRTDLPSPNTEGSRHRPVEPPSWLSRTGSRPGMSPSSIPGRARCW